MRCIVEELLFFLTAFLEVLKLRCGRTNAMKWPLPVVMIREGLKKKPVMVQLEQKVLGQEPTLCGQC